MLYVDSLTSMTVPEPDVMPITCRPDPFLAAIAFDVHPTVETLRTGVELLCHVFVLPNVVENVAYTPAMGPITP